MEIKKNVLVVEEEEDKVLPELVVISYKSLVAELKLKHKHKISDTTKAALLYFAFRKAKLPRSLDEISYITLIERKEIGRSFMRLKKIFGTKFCKETEQSLVSSKCIIQSNSTFFTKRFGENLNLDEDTIKRADTILSNWDKSSGKSPMIVAGAALYLACLLNGKVRTQREVADVAGCTEVAIRDNYTLMLTDLEAERGVQDGK